jgi:transposase
MASGKRGLQNGLKNRARTVILFIDSIVLNEIPPLRAAWAPIGEQAQVPTSAAHDTRVLTGVLNIKSGDCVLHVSTKYRQADAQAVLRQIRAHWRGWRIVLFLDRHPAQWARATRHLARHVNIQLRWLPTACPELNVMDHLWRHVTDDVIANEPTPSLDTTAQRAVQHIRTMSPQARRRQAGILSDSFWLANVLT